MQEEKASGESSNYPEAELIVPNTLPLALVHITVSVISPLYTVCQHPWQTECIKNQVLFASLHIQSMHIGGKWIPMPSQKHVPAVGSICHTWGCVETALRKGLSNGGLGEVSALIASLSLTA